MTGTARDVRATPTRSRGRTCGWGRTTASRPHRRLITDAAPWVSVITTVAAGTSTSNWDRCRDGSAKCGLCRSCTVSTSGMRARRRVSTTRRSSSMLNSSKPKCTCMTSKEPRCPKEEVGLQEPRRPPLPRQRCVARSGVRQQTHPRRVDHRLDVGMARRHRSHGEHSDLHSSASCGADRGAEESFTRSSSAHAAQ